jgi:hypothetical protein
LASPFSFLNTLFTHKFHELKPHFLLSPLSDPLSLCLSMSLSLYPSPSPPLSLSLPLACSLSFSTRAHTPLLSPLTAAYRSDVLVLFTNTCVFTHYRYNEHSLFVLFTFLLTITQKNTHTQLTHTAHTFYVDLTCTLCICACVPKTFMYMNKRRRFLIVCPKATHVPSYHAKFVLLLCYIYALSDSMHT